MLTRCKQHQHRRVSLFASLVLWDGVHDSLGIFRQVLRRSAPKHSDERNCLTSAIHPHQPLLLHPTQHEFESTHTIHGNHSGPLVRISQALQNARDALTTSLVASTGFPSCWAMVRATNLRTTSPVTIPRTPPSGLDKAVILPSFTIFTTVLEEHVQCCTRGGGVLSSSQTDQPPHRAVQTSNCGTTAAHPIRKVVQGCD